MNIDSGEHIKILIKKYIETSLTDEERFQLERKALDDPLLFDALHAYSKNPGFDHLASIELLEQNVLKSKKTKPKIISIIWKIAAFMVILLASTLSFNLFNQRQQANDTYSVLETNQEKTMVLPENEHNTEPKEDLTNKQRTEIEKPVIRARKEIAVQDADPTEKKEVNKDERSEFAKVESTEGDNANTNPGISQEETGIAPKISNRAAAILDNPESAVIMFSGQILDSDSDQGLSRVGISVSNMQFSTKTDTIGFFSLSLPYSSDSLIFKKQGYRILTVKNNSRDGFNYSSKLN